jgi:hypothetical protein
VRRRTPNRSDRLANGRENPFQAGAGAPFQGALSTCKFTTFRRGTSHYALVHPVCRCHASLRGEKSAVDNRGSYSASDARALNVRARGVERNRYPLTLAYVLVPDQLSFAPSSGVAPAPAEFA